MGVPGLWDLIRPAAARSSLSTLAKEAFLTNRNDLRALMIGIDASIWIFHAQIPQGGENPFLRTIFYKIATLLQQPVLPVFVFDGPDKPKYKRNCAVKGDFGSRDWRSKKFKELLDVCGLEWWNAPGEAEAELAIMNRQGKIDAVLSDDVDALLFGATKLLRNNSPTLSGSKASSTQNNSARGDQRHYEVYTASAIHDLWSQKEGSALQTEEDCRMAMVLIALLGGGDYAPEGIAGFGSTTTHGLAHAGLAQFLSRYDPDNRAAFEQELRDVHARMVEELRTNASGHVGKKYAVKARDLAQLDPLALFPSTALDAYLRPATSPLDDVSKGWPGFGKGLASARRGKARNEGRGDIEGMARACEKYFEWGTKEIVTKKFASENVGIFGGAVLDEARSRVRHGSSVSPVPVLSQGSLRQRGATDRGLPRLTDFFVSSGYPIQRDKASQPAHVRLVSQLHSETNYPDHVLKIHSTRPDPTNPALTEYRVSFLPEKYVVRCQGAMDGTRCDPKDLSLEERQSLGLVDRTDDALSFPPSSQSQTSKSDIRVWLPEYLLRAAWPDLVAEYEEELRLKADRKARPAKKPVEVVIGAKGQGRQSAKPKKAAAAPAAAEANRFKSFFASQRPAAAPARCPMSEDEEEEVEFIESPRRRTVERSSSRSPKPRSLSPTKRVVACDREGRKKAALSLPSKVPASPRPRQRASPERNTGKDVFTIDLSVSPPPKTRRSRSPRSQSVLSSATASVAGSSRSVMTEVIDLCSSDDDDVPRQPAAQMLPLSSQSSLPAVTASKRRSPRNRPRGSTGDSADSPGPAQRAPRSPKCVVSPPGSAVKTPRPTTAKTTSALLAALATPPSPVKTADAATAGIRTKSKNKAGAKAVAVKASTQTSLDMPVPRRASPPKAKTSAVKTTKPKKAEYVVVYEDDDLEVLDCRRR